ncbi:MAG: AAA family ATPase [Dehalococcoidia bacterium]|nr:AAA family ATPase [Dehalococcoidia bacterium]
MAKIIAVANQKGGTAKTTTTLNLGAALAEKGRRVLLIDMDPQGSLAVGWGISDVYNLPKTVYHVLMGEAALKETIISVRLNVDVAPANIYLSAAEFQLINKHRREDKLKNALQPVRDLYDYIMIDCPPSLGLLTVNALSASDQVLIPMSCDFYSMVGVTLLLDTIREIQVEVNPKLTVLGILATRYDARTLHSREVLERTKIEMGKGLRVFESLIKETVRFKESPVVGQSILEYAGNNDGARAYRALAEEVENG